MRVTAGRRRLSGDDVVRATGTRANTGDPRPNDLVPAQDVRTQPETFAVTSCRGG